MSASSRAGSSSPGSDSEHSDTAQPTRRPQHELANYRGLVRDLGAKSRGLATHLARQSRTSSQVDDEDENQDEDEEEGGISSEYASAVGSIEGSRQRKRRRPYIPTSKSLDDYSTRWPLHPNELGNDDASLAEAIADFASAYIRRQGLRLPHATPPEEGDDPLLPPGLETRVIESVNTVLVRLAAAQAPLSRSQRLNGPPFTLRTVLEIAAQNYGRSDRVVDRVNERLRGVCPQHQDIQLPLHRRKLVEAATGDRNVGNSLDSLYAPIKPSVDKKPHHTAAEAARRAEKRAARLARKKPAS